MTIDELKEKYTYETSNFVTIDELDIHYCDEGDGEGVREGARRVARGG